MFNMFKKIFDKKILLTTLLFLSIFTIGIHFVNAENQIFLENLPGLKGLENAVTTNFKEGGDASVPLKMYVNWIIQASVVLGSILAVGLIIKGGIEYMTTGTFTGKSEGKETVTNAILGLIFLISAYLIFQKINPNILNIHLSSAGKIVADAKLKNLSRIIWDSDLYEQYKEYAYSLGYTKEVCGDDLTTKADRFVTGKNYAKEDCEKMRALYKQGLGKGFKGVELDSFPCIAKEIRDLTNIYRWDIGCTFLKVGSVANECKNMLTKQGFTCSGSCNISRGECEEKAKEMIEDKLIAHNTVRTNFSCKIGHGSRAYFCINKGVGEIDKSKYIRLNVSCISRKCDKVFKNFKKNNNWSNSCKHKFVFKEYNKKNFRKSKLWIYIDKKTCK